MLLRLNLNSLGQECPEGWSSSVKCKEDEIKETNAQGCQRCVPKSQAAQSGEECIRTLQFWLSQNGFISPLDVTGSWNEVTKLALEKRVGKGWESFPGGACGILAGLQTGMVKAPAQPFIPEGFNWVPLVAIGALGLIGLIWFLGRKKK